MAFLLSTLVLLTALAPSTLGAHHSGGFQDPGIRFRPKFRYWLPDASVPSETVAKDISSLASVGAGGLEFVPFYFYGLPGGSTTRPTDWSEYGFGSSAFNAIFKDALLAAEKEGISVDFAVGANQGQGVPSEPLTPGLAVELLLGNTSVFSGQTFAGPVPAALAPSAEVLSGGGFMNALEQFGTPNLTAVIALRVTEYTETVVTIPNYGQIPFPTVKFDESSFIDLGPSVDHGSMTLNWTAPLGDSEWRIFSFWQGYTNQRSCAGGIGADTIIGNGSWTVDHFSDAGAKRTTDFLDEHIFSDEETARLLRSVGHYAWEDSLEIMASLYWTPDLLEQFRQINGYDLTKYLPLLFTISNSWFQTFPSYLEIYSYGNYTASGESVHNLDYRATLNAGYQKYVSHFTNWAHSRGIEYSDQPAYNLPLQMLSDIPLLDAPEGESLGFNDLVDVYRQFAGPAHLEGKTVISTELGAVDTPAYSMTVPDLLFRAKRSFAGGFTMAVIHGSPYSGDYPNTTWPGYTTFFYRYTEMWNLMQPCWQHMRGTIDYLARNMYILQQGVPQVDLAMYLYASPWTPVSQYTSANLQDIGYTYDYLGPDNLVSQSATVAQAVLSPNGPAYKALIFSGQTVITAEAAEAVAEFATSGLPIIVVGFPPNESVPYTAANQQRVNSAAQTLRSLQNVRTVQSTDELPATLADLGIAPRISLNFSSNPVYPVWRARAQQDAHYIFLYNDQPTAADCIASLFASESFTPYVYDAWTGSQERLVRHTRRGSAIEIPLHLDANQTTIIALRAESKGATESPVIASVSSTVESLRYTEEGRVVASLTGPGHLTTTNGTTLAFDPSLPPAVNLTQWDIVIEDWHAPVDNPYQVQTSVTLHTFPRQALIPWSDLGTGMDAVGGIGKYTALFAVPLANSTGASRLGGLLSLGPVVHTARVWIDGEVLAPIDPASPTVSISDHIVSGKTHNLTIEVTTPLFNRIKAAANDTMVWGIQASLVQSQYGTLPARQYGLLGPVSIQWTALEELA